MFNRNNVKSAQVYVPSIASAGSVIAGVFMAPATCEITGLRFIQGGGGTITSGWQLNVYKNASNAGSRIATTGSTAVTVANTGYDKTSALTSTASLKKLAAGDIVLYELVVVDAEVTVGSKVILEYVYGYVD